MNSEHRQTKGVGDSFDAWAARIYPGRLVVNKSTRYLRKLRSRMLCVIGRIDDELSRREKGQRRSRVVEGGVEFKAAELE